MNKLKYQFYIFVLIFGFIFLFNMNSNIKPVFAENTDKIRSWNYEIDETSSLEESSITAEVDTIKQEIRLKYLPISNLIEFDPTGEYNFAILTEEGIKHYGFDGSKFVENAVIDINITDPLSLALPTPYPDTVVSNESGVYYYKFNDSEIPNLSVLGMQGIYSVASTEQNKLVVLKESQVETYMYDGSNLVEVPQLRISGINDPLSVATRNNSIAVLEKNAVKWYEFDGSSMVFLPAMSLDGLSNLKAFDIDETRISLLTNNEIRTYKYDIDNQYLTFSSALSITSGLTDPRALAIRPGSNDLLIVDGNEIKFYMFDGSKMVEVESLSLFLSEIAKEGFKDEGQVIYKSKVPDIGGVLGIDMVRVRAKQETPPGTKIKWYIRAGEDRDWQEYLIVEGTDKGQVIKVKPKKDESWQLVSEHDLIYPANTNKEELWAEVEPGSSVQWKVELYSENKDETPRIYYDDGFGILLEVNTTPEKPELELEEGISEDGWIYVTTPTFKWSFKDPDEDNQSYFRFVIYNYENGEVIYDSGKVVSGEYEFKIPETENVDENGLFWNSDSYRFTAKVKVWDIYGGESEYSDPVEFKVMAFENPRILEITSSVNPIELPVLIKKGTVKEDLPSVKAGAKVVLTLDVIGPLIDNWLDDLISDGNTSASYMDKNELFPYMGFDDKNSVLNTFEKLDTGTTNVSRWKFSLWTDASPKVTPNDTCIGLKAIGRGSDGVSKPLTHFWTLGYTGDDKKGTFNYADGIFRIEGSVYEDWNVILHGRER